MDDFYLILAICVLVLAAVLLLLIIWKKVVYRVTVFEHEQGIHYRNGKFKGLLTPGVHWLFHLNSTVITVDVRPTLLTVPGQEVLFQGNIPVKVTMLATYQYIDLVKAHVTEGQAIEKLYALLQLGLRRAAALTALEDLLQNRREIVDQILTGIDADMTNLGFRLLKLDIKDLTLSGEIKKGYIQVMTAKQEGLAALEKARNEMASLRSLANAAKMLEGNPALYQLRLLQALGEGQGNTLVIGANGLPDFLKVQDSISRD
ncbi:MAG: slipin family protein [Bacillota bacterium]|nr:slipin family protein [Bacillota bacterium]